MHMKWSKREGMHRLHSLHCSWPPNQLREEHGPSHCSGLQISLFAPFNRAGNLHPLLHQQRDTSYFLETAELTITLSEVPGCSSFEIATRILISTTTMSLFKDTSFSPSYLSLDEISATQLKVPCRTLVRLSRFGNRHLFSRIFI